MTDLLHPACVGRHSIWGGVRDWSARSDPGAVRLRSALQAVCTMGAAMLAEWLFVHASGAMQVTVPAGASARAAAGIHLLDHATLVIAIVLGTMIGMMSGFAGPMCTRVRSSLVMFGWIPVPMIAAMALGLAIGSHRLAALVGMGAVFTIGTYARRFGPHGFLGGILGFIGYFLGFFLRAHAGMTLADLGWLAAETLVGAAVGAAVQLTLFFPSRRAAAYRAARSYRARVAHLARLCLGLLDAGPADRLRAQVHRRLDRVGEGALILDARLAELTAANAGWPEPGIARALLADHEAALVALTRAVERAATTPPADRLPVRAALAAIADGDLAGLARQAERLRSAAGDHSRSPDDPALAEIADAATRLAASWRSWSTGAGVVRRSDDASCGEAPVVLFGGWLPGSTLIARAASRQAPGGGLRMPPHLRAAVQMAVAGGLAIWIGDLVSGYRFYWAGLAAFFILVGTNTSGEQVRKGVYRVAGTAVGVLVAIPIVALAGNRPAAVIAVVLAAMFFGLYLIRISYALMIVGVTIAVAELYVEFGEFTDGLLMLRLVETLVGAAVAAVTVLLVLPLRPSRVTDHATREYLRALAELTAAAEAGELTGARHLQARQIDVAYQTLLAAAGARYIPYGRLAGSGNPARLALLHAAAAAHDRARAVLSAPDTAAGSPDPQQGLREAVDALARSDPPGRRGGLTRRRSAHAPA